MEVIKFSLLVLGRLFYTTSQRRKCENIKGEGPEIAVNAKEVREELRRMKSEKTLGISIDVSRKAGVRNLFSR